MPKKGGKKAAFYLYMQDRKPELEKKLGKRINMGDMAELVRKDWENMPAEEKQQYKSRRDQNPAGEVEKYLSDGTKISDIQKREAEAAEYKNIMEATIRSTVEALEVGGIQNGVFFIIDMSYFDEVLDEKIRSTVYPPAEITVTKWSMKDGILKEFHKILDSTNAIPKGYEYSAQVHSSATHKLYPTQEFCDIFEKKEFEEFIREGDKLSPLYTLEGHCGKEISKRREMLNDLLGERVDIYSLDSLLVQLAIVVQNLYMPNSLGERCLDDLKYSFNEFMGCSIHLLKFKDAREYCTKYRCQKWIYLIFDLLKIEEKFGIKRLPYFHEPGIPNELIRLERNFKGLKTSTENAESSKGGAKKSSARTWGAVTDDPICLNEDNFPGLSAPMGRGRGGKGKGKENQTNSANILQIGKIKVPAAQVTQDASDNVWQRRPLGRGKKKPE